MKCKNEIINLISAVVMFLGAGVVCSQDYPNKPIRIIVPATPGGNTDFMARAIGQKLTESLGQPVVIDYRAGGGTNIASELVARAAPDGYTLLAGQAALTANMTLYRKLSFDTVRDFAPITMVTEGQLILLVHPSVPAKSVKELIALAKSHPDKLTYASAGIGLTPHLVMELFKSRANVKILHVPYKGGSQATVDVLAGHVDMMFAGMSQLPVVKGKLRALAVSGSTRWPATPDVPTVAEAGIPGFEAVTWQGMLAPARTPKQVIDTLYTVIKKSLQLPDVREYYARVGFAPVGSSPEEFAAYIKADVEKWAKVIRESGATAD